MSTVSSENLNQKEINRRWVIVFWFNLYAAERLGRARGSFAKTLSSNTRREFLSRVKSRDDIEFVVENTDERFTKVAEEVRDELIERRVV